MSTRNIEDLANKFNWPSKPKVQQCHDLPDFAPKVYFMVGCQRSGSNWLRTMLGEREDLIAPHPPHIMRDFMPILSKFGDLDHIENLKILVDHVCTFVENNQVTWYDKHDRQVTFNRKEIAIGAAITVKALRAVQEMKEQDAGNLRPITLCKMQPQKRIPCCCGRLNGASSSTAIVNIIDHKYYLLAIFDEIMNFFSAVNDKHTWMCKSMGMSKYHDMLLTMYGPERLRYIYLVRDPRDVTLSFMKTPVGDSHPYSIAKKWAKLQENALYIKAKNPELLHEVRYEDVISDKVNEVGRINEFIGQQRTGKIMRRGSVVVIKDDEKITNEARKGQEATKAAVLSYQFKNLTRGDSFSKNQFQKWRKEMNKEDGQIVETVARNQMNHLGYKCSFIDVNTHKSFCEEEIAVFEQKNKHLVKEMNSNLKTENPGDFARRVKQSSVLELKPTYITESFVNEVCDLDALDELETSYDCYDDIYLDDFEYHDWKSWPKDADRFGFIPEQEIEIVVTETKSFDLKGGRSMHFAAASQKGYYPRQRDKKNQDSYLSGVHTLQKDGILFSVFDGHGIYGTECSQFVRDLVKDEFLEGIPKYQEEQTRISETNHTDQHDVESAFFTAYQNANKKLRENDNIDSSQSGTAAISLYIENDTFHVSNVGDSRCIIVSSCARKKPVFLQEKDYEIDVLSQDQTLEREDEMKRIESCGGLVMSLREFDAMTTQEIRKNKLDSSSHTNPTIVSEDGPLRIWASDGEKLPGCAFTRSIGDDVAKGLGVIAEPEYCKCEIRDDHKIFILGSDGIFDFIPNDEAAHVVKEQCNDASEACRALVGLAYARWINSEERTDDLTVIVGFLEKDSNGIFDEG